MHHLELDDWSRKDSFLHRRDARAKILGLICFLLSVALTPNCAAPYLWVFGAVPLAALLVARIPLARAFVLSAAVLPFAAVFGLASLAAGGHLRAIAVAEKSFLSALGAVALIATTPLPKLTQGFLWLGAPKFLVLVIQFLYRYLYVISEQAQHMRLAAASRGSRLGSRFRMYRLRAASGALAVLFSKSYLRAEAIHHSMLSRLFSGRFGLMDAASPTLPDYTTLVLLVLINLLLNRFIVLISQCRL